MALFASIFLLVIATPYTMAGTGSEWTYSGDKGPSHWVEDYPDCGGVTQSPINIDSSRVLYNPTMQRFDMSEYSKTRGVKMDLVNKEGHTAEVDFTGEQIRLRGGSLPDNYVLSQFHFHWGGASRRGSEHTLDGKHFPMELHLVHYQDHLKNLTAAQAHPNGLAVLGYFFKIGKHNANFEQLLKYFSRITETDQHVEIDPFPLLDLLPSPIVDFYRYDGSLTTPPCYESVIWSIATDPIEIAETQVEIFRTLHDKDNHPLVDDFRPIQPINQRTITTTVQKVSEDQSGTSCHMTASATFVLILFAFALLLKF